MTSHHCKNRATGSASADRDNEIIKYLRQGFSGAQIAKKIGVGFSTICYRIRTKGLKERARLSSIEAAKIVMDLPHDVAEWFTMQAGDMDHADMIRAIIIDAYHDENS